MVGSLVRTRRARRLVTLLAMAVIVTALSGVAPAAAGGKPMPAGGKPMPAGGKPMPLTSGQRSVVAANRQVADALAATPGPGASALGTAGVTTSPRSGTTRPVGWNDRIDQVSVC